MKLTCLNIKDCVLYPVASKTDSDKINTNLCRENGEQELASSLFTIYKAFIASLINS